MALYAYNKRYPLVTKTVSISTRMKKDKKVALFGENRTGSPVFSTIKGYHEAGYVSPILGTFFLEPRSFFVEAFSTVGGGQ